MHVNLYKSMACEIQVYFIVVDDIAYKTHALEFPNYSLDAHNQFTKVALPLFWPILTGFTKDNIR